MEFYDRDLKPRIEMNEYAEVLKQYPDWVAEDVARLLDRRIDRQRRVDRLAGMIIKERP